MRSRFLPEGRLLHTAENDAACASCDGLRRAMEEGTVLEGVAQLCDGAHNLLVSVGPFTGFLPREEAALGIAEGTTREIAILSRVGKPVCFQITALEESGGVLRPRLSRRRAQQAALEMEAAYLDRWVGRTVPVLFEEERDGLWRGHTTRYSEVAAPSGENLHNQLRQVYITGRAGNILQGELCEGQEK